MFNFPKIIQTLHKLDPTMVCKLGPLYCLSKPIKFLVFSKSLRLFRFMRI